MLKRRLSGRAGDSPARSAVKCNLPDLSVGRSFGGGEFPIFSPVQVRFSAVNRTRYRLNVSSGCDHRRVMRLPRSIRNQPHGD